MRLQNEDLAALFLRLGVGGLMLPHGIHKLMHGYEVIGSMLSDAGLPEALRHGVIVGEVLAPFLIVIGLWTRPSALALVGTMVMSIVLAFRDKLFTLNSFGGWVIELNMLFLLGGLALIFLGSGKYSVSRGKGKLD